MNGMRSLLVVLCSCCLSAKTPAQEVLYTELPTQKLLPVAHIHRVLQDREGYMWYATEGGGLCRDDGYRIDVFRSDARSPHLLGSNTLTCLSEDSTDRIWIGTTDGLYRLDKSDYHIEPAGRGTRLDGRRTDAVMTASDGTVWVASSGRIYHFSARDELLGEFPSVWNGHDALVAGFYEDRHHRIWVVQWQGGLLRYEAGKRQMTVCSWPCDVSPGMMVEDSANHCFYIGTWGRGIVTYRPAAGNGEAQVEYQASTYAGDGQSRVLGMHWDERRRVLWTAALDDLYAYEVHGDTLLPADLSGFLPEGKKILDQPASDKWGNIWIPGYSPHTFILSEQQNRVRRDPVRPMRDATGYPVMVDRIVDDGEGYWIWQGRTRLSYYSPVRGGHIWMMSEQPGSVGRYVYGTAMEKCRRTAGVWVSSGMQVVRVWREGGRFDAQAVVRLPEEGNAVHKIVEDDSGNLWIATGAGLYRYAVGESSLRGIFMPQGGVRDFLLLPDGGMCCVTGTGRLVLVRKNGAEQILGEGDAYTAVADDGNGTLWAATSQGEVYAYSLRDGKLRLERNAGNANGDAVKALEADSRGHVWILADQYVKEYSPHTRSFRLLRNDDREIHMDYFHTLRRMGDSICIGGIGAFCKVASFDELDRPALPVRPVVSAYEVDGVRHFVSPRCPRVEFTAAQDNVSFFFSSLDHLHAGKISYAYRLKGSGGDWTYLPQGINTVTFYNLAPGNYTLELKATDMHGCWGRPQECLSLHRLPPWYATWWAYTLYIMAGIALSVSFIRRMHHRQQQKVEEQLTQMKFRFFTNMSHELRTPLTLIITPLGSLLETVSDSRLRQQLEAIHRHACELLEQINHLLDFRKLETGEEKAHLREGSMADFVRSACRSFVPLAESRQINFNVDLPSADICMRFDKEKMHRVLYNLLSNALKFTEKGGSVKVRLERIPGRSVVLSVQDTGCGMSAEEAGHVFDRYYQGKKGTEQTGSGIGLHLVKTYVQLHGGRMELDTKEGAGSVFRVILPDTLSVVAQEEEKSSATNGTVLRKTVLVVEDNEELRGFLVRRLSEEYMVRQAADGQAALELLEQYEVDIIVSDVMMPVMNGAELCRKVKTDVRTSHIFVILLTAYSGDESALQGYEAGADCYLTKPFSMDILQNRIRHFSALQDRRKAIFLSGVEFRAEDMASTQMDEAFLRKAVALVEKNLDNTDYTVEQFSADLCMSRMNLYRKLQSLTGQKPSEFIRGIRLKKAAVLLAEHHLPVAEVADLVGFSTAGYFSKCFKEMFGVLPTQYGS